MITTRSWHFQGIFVFGLGTLLLTCGTCFSQIVEQQPNDQGFLQVTIPDGGLEVISQEIQQLRNPDELSSRREEVQMLPPEIHTGQVLPGVVILSDTRQHETILPAQNSPATYFGTQQSAQTEWLAKQGSELQQLRELVERVLSALEANKPAAPRDIEVAGFEAVDQANAQPRAVMPDGVVHLADSKIPPNKVAGPQLRQLEALKESAVRLQRAGLPELAQELRGRADHLEREIKEKHERMEQQRQRAEAEMRERTRHRQFEQRPQGMGRGSHPAPPMQELHEQLEALRHEMHSIDKKVTHLTELIETHHRTAGRRGHHQDMDDDDDCDDDDCDDDDCDDDDCDDDDCDGDDCDDDDCDDDDCDDDDCDDDDCDGDDCDGDHCHGDNKSEHDHGKDHQNGKDEK